VLYSLSLSGSANAAAGSVMYRQGLLLSDACGWDGWEQIVL